jgi:hypothetical protein
VEDLVGDTSRLEQANLPDATPAGWHQVVGRYRDGRLVRGYTSDFSPSRTYLHISPVPGDDVAQFVSLIQLDALFFVRDARAAVSGEEGTPPGSAPRGRKVALALPNGSELIGSTLNYTADGSGFFIHPLDSQSGATRVFVTQSGIRNVRFL